MKKLKKVLLIDDDTISSWLNQTMLERTGLVEHVECIYEGQLAIEYLKQNCLNALMPAPSCPDLIFLDLDMPIVNGFDVLEALQGSENCAWLIPDRIIVLTTSINQKDLEMAKEFPILDFLVKPLTETKITGVLADTINRLVNKAPAAHRPKSSNQLSEDRESAARNTPSSAAAEENKTKEV